MSRPSTSPFPDDFRWGVATSSYQIEGAVRADERGPSIWDTFCLTPRKVVDGDTGEVACDHYHLWRRDLDLMAELGIGAYRFSVAWPRVFPEGAGWRNEKGLDFYDQLVDGLLERGIEPHVTLYHWDLPQSLQNAGGWLTRDIADAFVGYADAVTARLGDRVASYATLNEPWCSAFLGYEKGEHAPGMTDRAKGLQAAHHLLLAHGAALEPMRANAPGAQHGIVLNLNPAYPATDTPADRAAAHRFDGFFNRWYLDPVLRGTYPEDAWEGYGDAVPDVRDGDLSVISRPIDFLGVNYYSRTVAADAPGAPWPAMRGTSFEAERTDMGWEVYPQGLTDLLIRLKRAYDAPPLYVMENGAAYPDELRGETVHDPERIRYFERHIAAIRAALDEGVDVRGFFAWSFLDNFEWAFGYSKRFGLVYVDYETQNRIPKDSAQWYAEFIATQGERREATAR